MTRQWQDNDNKHDQKKGQTNTSFWQISCSWIFNIFCHASVIFCNVVVMFLSCFIVFLYVCMLLVCDVSCLTVVFQFSYFCSCVFFTFYWFLSLFHGFLSFLVVFIFFLGFLHVFIGFLLLFQRCSLLFSLVLIDF